MDIALLQHLLFEKKPPSTNREKLGRNHLTLLLRVAPILLEEDEKVSKEVDPDVLEECVGLIVHHLLQYCNTRGISADSCANKAYQTFLANVAKRSDSQRVRGISTSAEVLSDDKQAKRERSAVFDENNKGG